MLVIEGKLTIEEAQVSPLRTILVNAIGVSADVGVEMAHVALKRDDRLLLCSDGLHDYFPADEEIAQRLSAEKPGEALAEMVELAKTRGGNDNITGVAVHVVEVVEPVAGQFGDESTQPVEVGNPFMADEPTQTAFTAQGMTAPNAISLTPPPGRNTQPMRAMDTDHTLGTAPTDPPPIKEAIAAPFKTDDDAKTVDDDAKPEPLATADTGPAKAPKPPTS